MLLGDEIIFVAKLDHRLGDGQQQAGGQGAKHDRRHSTNRASNNLPKFLASAIRGRLRDDDVSSATKERVGLFGIGRCKGGQDGVEELSLGAVWGGALIGEASSAL